MAKRQAKKVPAASSNVLATAVAPDGAVDPTLLTSKVAVRGKEYTLCFDLDSLARAEHELRAAGHDVNVLSALPTQAVQDVLVMFAVSLRRFHPEISYADALNLPKLSDVFAIRLAISDAWRRSLAEPDLEDNKNPTQPGR